jgi:transcriptional regulator with XRE-family HTH domain
MYEIFEELLKEKGITPYRLSKDTKVSTATLTSWKQGKYTPKPDKLKIIAEYLGVSVEYLTTGKEKRFDKFSNENAKLIAKVACDQQALSMLDMFLKLSEDGKKELEKMAEFKLELENKKE